MPNENIFAGGDPTPNPVAAPAATVTPDATPAADPAVVLLSTIKGDDGQQKYKDVPTALSALQHSQEYIKQLKQQLEEASQKASQAVTMEQVLAAINKPADAPTPPSNPSQTPAGLTAEDVLKLLKAEEQKKVTQANAAKVAQKFKEVHGEKAEEVFYARAAEMGLTRDAINSLAATSPEAVFSMFGLKGGQAPAPATPSGINTSGMQVPGAAPRAPVMGFKTDSELLDYWKKLKAEVNASLNVK